MKYWNRASSPKPKKTTPQPHPDPDPRPPKQGLFGYLRKGAGTTRRRITGQSLRQTILPRRPAFWNLSLCSSTNHARSNKENAYKYSNSNDHHNPKSNNYNDNNNNTIHHIGSEPTRGNVHNELWDGSNPPKISIRFLERLKMEPATTKEDLLSSYGGGGGGANLDDLVEMACLIRAPCEYDWETLLEDDIEEEMSCAEEEGIGVGVGVEMDTEEEKKKYSQPPHIPPPKTQHQPQRTPRRRERPPMTVREKPSIHLQRQRNTGPEFGPGILIS